MPQVVSESTYPPAFAPAHVLYFFTAIDAPAHHVTIAVSYFPFGGG